MYVGILPIFCYHSTDPGRRLRRRRRLLFVLPELLGINGTVSNGAVFIVGTVVRRPGKNPTTEIKKDDKLKRTSHNGLSGMEVAVPFLAMNICHSLSKLHRWLAVIMLGHICPHIWLVSQRLDGLFVFHSQTRFWKYDAKEGNDRNWEWRNLL